MVFSLEPSESPRRLVKRLPAPPRAAASESGRAGEFARLPTSKATSKATPRLLVWSLLTLRSPLSLPPLPFIQETALFAPLGFPPFGLHACCTYCGLSLFDPLINWGLRNDDILMQVSLHLLGKIPL